jgi:hypothetical protein
VDEAGEDEGGAVHRGESAEERAAILRSTRCDTAVEVTVLRQRVTISRSSGTVTLVGAACAQWHWFHSTATRL